MDESEKDGRAKHDIKRAFHIINSECQSINNVSINQSGRNKRQKIPLEAKTCQTEQDIY